MHKKALVLSGGSIRGAFQAGAILGILDAGFQPDIIQGISAGALNASALVSETGKMGENIDWIEAGKALQTLWFEEIQEPDDIAKTRSTVSVIVKALGNNYQGFVDPKPLRELVHKYVKAENIQSSPVDLQVGAVDLQSGAIIYPPKDNPDIVDFVLASASIPLVMPVTTIKGRHYVDGGIRDTAPLDRVIEMGATEIVLILTQAPGMEQKDVDPGNVMHLAERTVDILLSEVLENDIKIMTEINKMIDQLSQVPNALSVEAFANKKKIHFTVVRPQEFYPYELNDFESADIRKMFEDGRHLAHKAIIEEHNPNRPENPGEPLIA